jgi:hypothetical protein
MLVKFGKGGKTTDPTHQRLVLAVSRVVRCDVIALLVGRRRGASDGRLGLERSDTEREDDVEESLESDLKRVNKHAT